MNRVALSSLIILAALSCVQASHFRYGSLTWTIPDTSTPNVVDFSLTVVFRLSYAWSPSPAVGNTYNLGDLITGDGGSETIYAQITNIDSPNDATTMICTVRHTYPVNYPQTYVAYWTSYARLTTLKNNANQNWEISAGVTLSSTGSNTSPVSSVLAITTAYSGQINYIQVRAADAQGGALTYTLSSPQEMGGLSNGIPPYYLTLDANTGMIRWDATSLTGLWNCQVKITDNMGAYIVVDFLLQLVAAPPPSQVPYYISPTPTDGSTLVVNVGDTLTFTVAAQADDSSYKINIQAGALPGGMTITNAVASNPASRSCSWSPTSNGQVGAYVVTFQAGTVSRSFSIRVVYVERCGDNMCSASENCSSCPVDCGDCPMVIWARGRPGYVVTATSFAVGATINLTMWDGKSTPTKYQAWNYDAITGFITLRSRPDLILGAGPIAQKQKTSLKKITWDFKAAIANKTVNPLLCHEFNFVPATAPWMSIFNRQFSTSALQTPYKPTMFTDGQIWGYHERLKGQAIQQFRWETYVCHSCPPSSLE